MVSVAPYLSFRFSLLLGTKCGGSVTAVAIAAEVVIVANCTYYTLSDSVLSAVHIHIHFSLR